ncbi:hypothetical protein K1719_002634 [Acacia pycnantha]|nr:hypothetical protein K1719_002634 [Acacia pycnantha]
MGGGTSLNYFQKKWPKHCFDVGIAEHAITFAVELATEGLKPFCAIYSTFLQRGYDQVIHDVDLQKLPVRFAIDRTVEWQAVLDFQEEMALEPFCLPTTKEPHWRSGTIIGKGRILIGGTIVAILGYGSMVQQSLQAAELLKSHGVYVTVADARFCKPLDTDLIKQLVKEHEILITGEEGSIGGFGSHVSHYLTLAGLLDGPLKLRAMMLPNRYIDHGSPQDQIDEASLSSKHIARTILSLLERPKEPLLFK